MPKPADHLPPLPRIQALDPKRDGSLPNNSDRARRAVVFEYKDPRARLLSGAFAPGEVRTVGKMVRGSDPRGELLSAF